MDLGLDTHGRIHLAAAEALALVRPLQVRLIDIGQRLGLLAQGREARDAEHVAAARGLDGDELKEAMHKHIIFGGPRLPNASLHRRGRASACLAVPRVVVSEVFGSASGVRTAYVAVPLAAAVALDPVRASVSPQASHGWMSNPRPSLFNGKAPQ